MAYVPSLEASAYLTDPQSIVAYQIRRFMRMPADTVPLMDDYIISLPWIVAQHSRDPETLCNNIESSLQRCLSRIFNGERTVTISVSYTLGDNDTYDVTMSVIYTQANGDLGQVGTTISLNKESGRLVIPEDNLERFFS